MCNITNNTSTAKVGLPAPVKPVTTEKPLEKPLTEDKSPDITPEPVEQKDSAYVKIEKPKEDKVAISFDTKNPKANTIQSLPFVEKEEKEKGIKSVINDITTFGPVKIDKVTVPSPITNPSDSKDSPKIPGTDLDKDKDKKISVQIKVKF